MLYYISYMSMKISNIRYKASILRYLILFIRYLFCIINSRKACHTQATLYRKSKLLGKRVDQYEPPHLDLRCLQIQIFSFWLFMCKKSSVE